MSLSKKQRVTSLADVLTLMLERLGDKAIDAEIYYQNEDPFDGVPQTTWRELEKFGLTKRFDTIGHPQWQLTGVGWCKALSITKRLSDPQFVSRLSKLTAAMKDAVKGRSEDAYLYVDELVSTSGLGEGFVINAIESRLIDRHFKIQGAKWEHPGKSVRVPLNFGLRPL